MDPPPLPPLHNATFSANPTTVHLNYPDSVESSPRSHPADGTFNETLPPVPGGETRMVAIDRNSSLATLSSRLSRTLLNGRPFTLKYQLPQEDLDSLVSVTTDEDLDNMIEEYDRINASSKPETAASMGSLLDDAKSETWFVDALNGSGLIPRNLSDSATLECLVTLGSEQDLEAQAEGVEGENRKEVHTTLSDSPVMEKNSSFGSSSSSPSMTNLPPIRVRVEDPRIGFEEQFAQMTYAQVVQKNDDGYGFLSAPPPPIPVSITAVGSAISTNPAGGSSENLNRLLSDDERSDQGVPISFSQTTTSCTAARASQTRCLSQLAFSRFSCKHPETAKVIFQSQALKSKRNRFKDLVDTRRLISSSRHLQGAAHFIRHPVTNPVPMTSYYPVYAPPSQQPHLPMDHQYPVYLMQVAQPQPYMSMQTNMADTAGASTSRPVATPPANYRDQHPPIYHANTVTSSAKPEMATTLYRTVMSPSPQLVQVPANQFQQSYMGYSQIQHPSQSINAAAASYAYSEYANSTNDQLYYTPSAQGSPLPPQFQSMNPAAGVALADDSTQIAADNTMQQNTGASQPI
ncbi:OCTICOSAPEPTIDE/PHOX/BEM1P FAMILY PROTEIN [Salix koriyanagi]|uniref:OCTICOSAPEPTIDE/PHOX/BEM1P FAMILY PROTEIN n=1 Tax=Salix koriyanagi TaxID=2511006 RepID=A0A9Q0WD63_9ROSI|nr:OCTICOSAPEPTIDE/PHOX/BEM1P FAMILY PROTEIN [Salix koriyanagi]